MNPRKPYWIALVLLSFVSLSTADTSMTMETATPATCSQDEVTGLINDLRQLATDLEVVLPFDCNAGREHLAYVTGTLWNELGRLVALSERLTQEGCLQGDDATTAASLLEFCWQLTGQVAAEAQACPSAR